MPVWKEMSYNKKPNKKLEYRKDYDYIDTGIKNFYGLSEDITIESTYSVEDVFDYDKYDNEWN
jgi:hypothetical protein